MSSRQLQDLTPRELADHAQEIYDAAREANATATTEARRPLAAWAAAAAREAVALKAIETADMAADLLELEAENAEDPDVSTNAECAAHERAAAIAYLDILHRQQMLGEWSKHINDAVVNKQTKKAFELFTKQEVKKHMGSMLGDWDKAGKLIKRHTSKNRKKTKRKRQKIAKRIKGTKRR